MWAPEVIGKAECPILHRWTLLDLGPRGVKLMVHRFMPFADDRDVHDHPRPFWTLVLAGGYDDLVPCPTCTRAAASDAAPGFVVDWRETVRRRVADPDATGLEYRRCPQCWPPAYSSGDGAMPLVVGDRMRRGMLRLRPASHRHRTRVGARGCWTLVLMGPLRRGWGFWRGSTFWPWKAWALVFGDGMRCGDEDPVR